MREYDFYINSFYDIPGVAESSPETMQTHSPGGDVPGRAKAEGGPVQAKAAGTTDGNMPTVPNGSGMDIFWNAELHVESQVRRDVIGGTSRNEE